MQMADFPGFNVVAGAWKNTLPWADVNGKNPMRDGQCFCQINARIVFAFAINWVSNIKKQPELVENYKLSIRWFEIVKNAGPTSKYRLRSAVGGQRIRLSLSAILLPVLKQYAIYLQIGKIIFQNEFLQNILNIYF